MEEKTKRDWFSPSGISVTPLSHSPLNPLHDERKRLKESKKRSTGKEQQIEGKADSDRGEWCYWCQCTIESPEKITPAPQVQMNAANSRKNERSVLRGLEGGGEAVDREGGFDPCASVNATLVSLHAGALSACSLQRRMAWKREQGVAGRQFKLIWHL